MATPHWSNSGEAQLNFGVLCLLALIFGIAAFATDMYLPAFPSLRRSFEVDAQRIQLSLSFFLYGNAVGQLVCGPLSDRFGRKTVLLCGLVTYAAASFGCATALTIDEFLGFRLAQGAAAASGPVLVRAWVNDRLTRLDAARALALLTGMMAFAAMLTPSLGGWLVQHFEWPVIFYLLGAAGLGLFVAAGISLRETLPLDRRIKTLGVSEIGGAYFSIARESRFWLYVLPPSIMFSAVFAYAGINSFLLIDDLGMSERIYGVSFSVAAGAFVTGSFVSHRVVGRLGIDRTVNSGIILGCCSASLALIASSQFALSIALVMLPALAMFFATALILPVAFAAAVNLFPTHGGSASALAGFTQLVFAALSTGAGKYLYDHSTLPLHFFTLAVCFGAAAIWFVGHRLSSRVPAP